MATVIQRTATITNKRGLHARAAAKFVQCLERFDAEVTVSRQDMEVSGCSIMGLMMLAASPGCQINMQAQGADAEAALDAVMALIEARFDEDQ